MLLLQKVLAVIVLFDSLRAQPMTGRGSDQKAVDEDADADFYDYFGIKSMSEGDTILLDANQQNPIIRRGDRQYLKPDNEYLSNNIVPDIAPEDDDDGIAMDTLYSLSHHHIDSAVEDVTDPSRSEQAVDESEAQDDLYVEQDLVDLSQYQLQEAAAEVAYKWNLHKAQVNSAVESLTGNNPYGPLSGSQDSTDNIAGGDKSSEVQISQRTSSRSQSSKKSKSKKQKKSKGQMKAISSTADDDALLEEAIKESAQMRAKQLEIQEKTAKSLILYHFKQYKVELETVIEDKIVETETKFIELEELFKTLLKSAPYRSLAQMQTGTPIDSKIEAFAGVLYFLNKLRVLVPQLAQMRDVAFHKLREIDQYVGKFESSSPEFTEITDLLKSMHGRVQKVVSNMETRVAQFQETDKRFCGAVLKNMPAIMSFVDLKLSAFERDVQAKIKDQSLDQDFTDYRSMEINRALQVLSYIGDEDDDVADSISKFRVSAQLRYRKIMLLIH
ncbi:hypothetical protein MP228_000470 [Amoeboaphelidium protococcarum]|nr:hypothetical protein MP228_000470 [Amoeboaphelidium protococcarum]